MAIAPPPTPAARMLVRERRHKRNLALACANLREELDRARATAVTLEQELARAESERVAADDLWRENAASLA